jgi:hypothetical protein
MCTVKKDSDGMGWNSSDSKKTPNITLRLFSRNTKKISSWNTSNGPIELGPKFQGDMTYMAIKRKVGDVSPQGYNWRKDFGALDPTDGYVEMDVGKVRGLAVAFDEALEELEEFKRERKQHEDFDHRRS